MESKSVRYKFLGMGLLALGYLPTFVSFQNAPSSKSNEAPAVVCSSSCSGENPVLKLARESVSTEESDQFLKAILNMHCEELAAVAIVPQKITPTQHKILAGNTKVIRHGKFANSKVVKGTVKFNFYVDARHAGVPAKVIDTMISNLSGKINFRRSLKQGNKFEVMFDKKNRLLYCEIEAGRNNKIKASVYGVEENGKMTYYYENGAKVHQTTSKTFGRPLNGPMIVSSPYGVRIHPVKKTRRYHSGVDLRAHHGTPVLAIMDGVVTRASRYSGYGNCVEINHAAGYKSLYGHLSRYAVKAGSKVKKGQVIAYTGSTGLSTGPHLHLELARYNKLMNPLSVKLMPHDSGTNNTRAFRNYKNQIKNAIK